MSPYFAKRNLAIFQECHQVRPRDTQKVGGLLRGEVRLGEPKSLRCQSLVRIVIGDADNALSVEIPLSAFRILKEVLREMALIRHYTLHSYRSASTALRSSDHHRYYQPVGQA